MLDIPRQTQATASSLGGSIRGAREALGLTQTACARSLGITKNSIAGIERGTDSRLATVLGVLAVLGRSMALMRAELGLSETEVAKRAMLALPVLRALEAGLSLDMPALTQLAGVYKGLRAAAAAAEATGP